MTVQRQTTKNANQQAQEENEEEEEEEKKKREEANQQQTTVAVLLLLFVRCCEFPFRAISATFHFGTKKGKKGAMAKEQQRGGGGGGGVTECLMDVWTELGESVPTCPHGPLLLFDEHNEESMKAHGADPDGVHSSVFFACSAHRGLFMQLSFTFFFLLLSSSSMSVASFSQTLTTVLILMRRVILPHLLVRFAPFQSDLRSKLHKPGAFE